MARVRKIENRQALDVIAQQDTIDTLFYCDPPYVRSTRTSLLHKGGDNDSGYAHEMSDNDHRALAAALHEIKGMAVDRLLGPDRERGKTWINFAADADHGASIGMPAGSTFKAFTLAAALDQDMPFGTRLNAPSGFTPTGYRNCKGQRVGDTKYFDAAGFRPEVREPILKTNAIKALGLDRA